MRASHGFGPDDSYYLQCRAQADHWAVVRGTALVTIGDNVTFLHENESIYVPSGAGIASKIRARLTSS